MTDQEIHPMDGNVGNPDGEMVPHSSNELSAHDVAKEAMDAAIKKAEEADEGEGDGAPAKLETEEKPDEKPIDWEAAKAAKDATPDSESAEAEQEDQIGDLEPLPAWDAATQDTFRKLDKEAQAFVLGVAEQASTPLQSNLEALEPWKRLADQWTPYFQQTLNGLPPDRAVESLLNADMVLRTGTDQQKLNLLNSIIRDYNIPLAQDPAPVVPDDLADDPVAQAVQGPIQSLMKEINDLKARFDSQNETTQTAQQQQAEQSLSAWAAAVGEDGKPLRPYFPEVRSIMESLYQSATTRGQSTTLEQLYDMACRAHPETWAKMQSAEKAASILERQKSAASKSKAASSVSGSSSGARSEHIQTNPNESAYDVARKAAIQHGVLDG